MGVKPCCDLRAAACGYGLWKREFRRNPREIGPLVKRLWAGYIWRNIPFHYLPPKTMANTPVRETSLPGLPVRRGKVRDVYDLGDRLLLVSTDRLSAFDWVLPTGIPDKGRVLTQIAAFWFNLLGEPNHLITTNVDEMGLPAEVDRSLLAGRSTLCRKTEVVPIECVVRGYLAGSGWKEYQQNGMVCGIKPAAGADRKRPAAGADFHAGHEGGRRPRREHLVRRGWSRSSAAIWPRNCSGAACGYSSAGRNTPDSAAS